MFSLPKLLVLALIIAGVIAAFRVAGTVRRLRADAARRQATARPPAKTEELLKCSGCGAYVPLDSPDPCGRGDCPRRPERS